MYQNPQTSIKFILNKKNMNYKELFIDNTYLLEDPEVKELINFCEYWKKKFEVATRYISKNGDIEYVKYLRYEDRELMKLANKESTKTQLSPECINDWEDIVYCSKEGKCLKCVTKTK